MTDLAFLLDAPTAPTRRYPVARLGQFRDRRYGDFAIDPALVAEWQRKLATTFDGQVAIDLDHAADRGGSTRAAGWIKGLDLDGDKVVADVEWTPYGEGLLKGGEYRYFSVSFADRLRDEQGGDLGPGLLGAALTNRPFFRDLPAVSLDAAAIDNPKETTTMPTLLDRKLEEADALMARNKSLTREEALRRSGAWQVMQDTLAETPVLLDLAGPEQAVADPPAGIDPTANFERAESIKAALGFDLNSFNHEALAEHRDKLAAELAGPRTDVPDHLRLDALPVNPLDDSHFERDKLRAELFGGQLDRETWQAYAHNGADAVAAEFREIALGKAAQLDGRVTQLRAYERERSEKYRAAVKRAEEDLKLLSDERDRERRILAAGRPGGDLGHDEATVTNSRIVELERKIDQLRANWPKPPSVGRR